ncbi:MAG TPA: helix-turn-helix domain-containing protein [Candidatus Acidoferrum sp.]|nr:helix-turn-helix domain-containing protein [Candidatus Acidoferrum sp.]
MQTNYEMAFNEFMPAFRAAAARLMTGKYGISQQQAAHLLEITQASISKYVNGRYSEAVKGTEAAINDNLVDGFVKQVVADHERDAQKAMCKACQRFNRFDCAIMIK